MRHLRAALTASVALVISLPAASAQAALLTEGSSPAVARASFAAATPANHKPKTCANPLIKTIMRAGFKGANIREAYAIAMRESNGNPRAISPSNDYGLFQINAGAWSGQSWWDSSSMLNADYNARIAHRISRGGKDWRMWGIRADGQGMDVTYYGMWSASTQYAWIWSPYSRYYASFPRSCRSLLVG